MKPVFFKVIILCTLWCTPVFGQIDEPFFRTDFPIEEFAQRRTHIYDVIGQAGIALIQGEPSELGYTTFRQNNTFYYLSGVETPHAYLLLNGATRTSSLYLAKSDEDREAWEGKQINANHPEYVSNLTGIENVYDRNDLREHLAAFIRERTNSTIFTPFAPAEHFAGSPDLGTRGVQDWGNDEWDERPSRTTVFVNHIKTRFPQYEVKNLTPTLDQMRLIKSPRELDLIRKITRVSGLGLMDAMRATEPGMYEYELDAVAKLRFYLNGAQGDAYYSLVSSGVNAYVGHYNQKNDTMEDGEFLLMDYAPDIGYYTSDVTRMWPVNGTFSSRQREIYTFYLACHTAILDRIRPGVTAGVIMKEAVAEMRQLFENTQFSKTHYAEAFKEWIDIYERRANRQNASLGHWVGMSVHDVGGRITGPLHPGMVFTVEPDWMEPVELIFISVEDVVIITETGAEIVSSFIPKQIDDIEKIMKEQSYLEYLPDKN